MLQQAALAAVAAAKRETEATQFATDAFKDLPNDGSGVVSVPRALLASLVTGTKKLIKEKTALAEETHRLRAALAETRDELAVAQARARSPRRYIVSRPRTAAATASPRKKLPEKAADRPEREKRSNNNNSGGGGGGSSSGSAKRPEPARPDTAPAPVRPLAQRSSAVAGPSPRARPRTPPPQSVDEGDSSSILNGAASPPPPAAVGGEVALQGGGGGGGGADPRLAEYRMLLSVAKEISSLSSFSDACRTLVKSVTSVMNAERATLFLVDSQAKRLRLLNASKQDEGEEVEELLLPLTRQSIAGSAALTGQTINVADVSSDSRWSSSVDASTTYVTKSLLAMPVRNDRGETVAVIEALNRLPKGYKEAEGAGGGDDAASAAAAAAAKKGDRPPSGSKRRGKSPKNRRGKNARPGSSSAKRKAAEAAAAAAAAAGGADGQAAGEGGGAVAQAPLDIVESFTEGDEYLLAQICSVAGNVLKNLSQMEAAQQNQAKLRHVVDMAHRVASEGSTREVIHRLIQVSCDLLRCDRLSIFKVDRERNVLVATHAMELKQQVVVPFGTGVVGHVADTGSVVSLANAYDDSRFDQSVDARTGYRTKTLLCLPCHDPSGEIVAVVQAVNKLNGKRFTSLDTEMLTCVAESAGVALFNTARHHDLLCSKLRAEARLMLSDVFIKNGDLPSLLDAIMAAGHLMLPVDRFTLFLVDHIRNELWVTTRETGHIIRVPVGHGIAGKCVAHAEIIRVADAYSDPDFDSSVDASTGFRTQSVLAVPVLDRKGVPEGAERSHGVLAMVQAINKRVNGVVTPFDDEDQIVLTTFCEEIEVALDKMSVEMAVFKVASDVNLEHRSEEAILTSSLVEVYNNRLQAPAPRAPAWRDKTVAVSNMQRDWSLNVLELDENTMVNLVGEYLSAEGMDLCSQFSIDAATLHAFSLAVARSYTAANPFHNFSHGFCTFHHAHFFVRTAIGKRLPELTALATLVAALCHDIDHPGTNNAFQISTRSKLAYVHNDSAVLERHHAHMTFDVMRRPGNNILENLSDADFATVRKGIIDAILATDMSEHFAMAQNLSTLTLPAEGDEAGWSALYPMFSCVFVHASDLSAQTLPLDKALAWGDRVISEFADQVQREQSLGIASAPFMIGLEAAPRQMKLQSDFVQFVLLPLWAPVGKILPELAPAVQNLENNLKFYQDEASARRLSELTSRELSMSVPDWPEQDSRERRRRRRHRQRPGTQEAPSRLSYLTSELAQQTRDALTGSATPQPLGAAHHELRIREALSQQWEHKKQPVRPATERPWRTRAAAPSPSPAPEEDSLPQPLSDSRTTVPRPLRVVQRMPVPPSLRQARRFGGDLDEATGEWHLTVFPPRMPDTRDDVRVLDQWLSQVTEHLFRRAEGPRQDAEEFDLTAALLQVHNMALDELARQVTLQCAERGELLRRLWQNQLELAQARGDAGDRERDELRAVLDSSLAGVRAENQRVLDSIVEDMQKRLDTLKAVADNATEEARRMATLLRNAQDELQAQLTLHTQLQVEIERLGSALRDSEDRGHRVAARLASLQNSSDSLGGDQGGGVSVAGSAPFISTGRKLVAVVELFASFMARVGQDVAPTTLRELVAELEDAFFLAKGTPQDRRAAQAAAMSGLVPVSAALDEVSSHVKQLRRPPPMLDAESQTDISGAAGSDTDDTADDAPAAAAKPRPPGISVQTRRARRLSVDPQVPLPALLEAQRAAPAPDARPLDLRKLRSDIAALYQSKVMSDVADVELGFEPVSVPAFALRYFVGLFGRKGLAVRHLHRLQAAVRGHLSDRRVHCFARLAGMRTCCDAEGATCIHSRRADEEEGGEAEEEEEDEYLAPVASAALSAIAIMMAERDAIKDLLKDPVDGELARTWIPLGVAREAVLRVFGVHVGAIQAPDSVADAVLAAATAAKRSPRRMSVLPEPEPPRSGFAADPDALVPAPPAPTVPADAPGSALRTLQLLEGLASEDSETAVFGGRLRRVAGLKVELEGALEAIYDGLRDDYRHRLVSARLASAKKLQAHWRGTTVRRRMARQREEAQNAELRELFRSYDANGDQVITFDEFCAMLQQLDGDVQLGEQLEMFVRLVDMSNDAHAGSADSPGSPDPEQERRAEDAIDLDIFCAFMRREFSKHPLHGWRRVEPVVLL